MGSGWPGCPEETGGARAEERTHSCTSLERQTSLQASRLWEGINQTGLLEEVGLALALIRVERQWTCWAGGKLAPVQEGTRDGLPWSTAGRGAWAR